MTKTKKRKSKTMGMSYDFTCEISVEQRIRNLEAALDHLRQYENQRREDLKAQINQLGLFFAGLIIGAGIDRLLF